MEVAQLPSPCVFVLVGPGASGKSMWAAQHFAPDLVVSSDRLRALVGAGEDDVAASAEALSLLDQVVDQRLGRRLTTVIDTLGFDAERRRRWLAAARRQGMACVAISFDLPATECRARNRNRPKRIPAAVLSSQLRAWPSVRDQLPTEGFDAVLPGQPVRLVPQQFATAAEAATRQLSDPARLRFGLHLGAFPWPAAELADGLRETAAGAEAAGFDALYVMDHFRQIPQIGRPWADFPESFTTLAALSAATSRVRLGVLVAGVTYRNPAHLGKIVATLDVLSGGRAVCGLGLAWLEAEHLAYGWSFPPVGERYALLADTLQLLPLLWGPGSPAFHGKVLHVPEAVCYPRPLQPHIPIVVGGGGERRTLNLAARYADGANVLGDVATVRRKAAVLRGHCRAVGRDPEQVELSHLSTVVVGTDDRRVAELVDRLRPTRQNPARVAARLNAGTIDDHIGRFRELAEAGAREVVVRLADLPGTDSLEAMARVIAAFREQ